MFDYAFSSTNVVLYAFLKAHLSVKILVEDNITFYRD